MQRVSSLLVILSFLVQPLVHGQDSSSPYKIEEKAAEIKTTAGRVLVVGGLIGMGATLFIPGVPLIAPSLFAGGLLAVVVGFSLHDNKSGVLGRLKNLSGDLDR